MVQLLFMFHNFDMKSIRYLLISISYESICSLLQSTAVVTTYASIHMLSHLIPNIMTLYTKQNTYMQQCDGHQGTKTIMENAPYIEITLPETENRPSKNKCFIFQPSMVVSGGKVCHLLYPIKTTDHECDTTAGRT